MGDFFAWSAEMAENPERVTRKDRSFLEAKSGNSKSFKSAFALDRAKLTRIINIAEERFASASLAFNPEYQVVLTDGRTISLTQHEELVSLDNAVKNPIRTLEIKVAAASENDTLSINLFFGDIFGNVRLNVTSTSRTLADQTFAEMEEQIERTLLQGLVYRYFKGSAALGTTVGALIITAGALFIYLASLAIHTRSAAIPPQEFKRLLDKAAHATTVEQKVDFMFQVERIILESVRPGPELPADSSSVRFWVIILPLLLGIGCAVYVISACYPTAVFVWGDYEEHYSQLLSRRKTLWNLLIGALLVGAIASLLASGLAGALGLS